MNLILRHAAISLLLIAGSASAADSAPPAPPPSLGPELEAAVQSLFPLTPAEIAEVRRRADDVNQVVQDDVQPDTTNRAVSVSLSPGATIPTIRLAANYVTTLVVVDSTGEPWPVVHHSVGSGERFVVERPEVNAHNLLVVTPNRTRAKSNLVLTLDHAPAPIALLLVSDPDQATPIAYLKVDRPGPNALAPVIGPAPEAVTDRVMQQFLDGTPPPDATVLATEPAIHPLTGEGLWSIGSKWYLRTRHTLRWPAYNQVATIVDGMRVYLIAPTDLLMLADPSGQTLTWQVIR